MEAIASQPNCTHDKDFPDELVRLGEHARGEIAERRARLMELGKQVAEQTRSLAAELKQQRSQLAAAETAVGESRRDLEQQRIHLETLRNELSTDRSEWDSHQTRVIQRQEKLLTALAEQYERLEAVREDFTQREAAFHEQQLRFEHEQTTFFSLQMQQAERDEQLDSAARNLQCREEQLANQLSELEQQEALLSKQREELAELRGECNAEREKLKAWKDKTQRQRKQYAAELRRLKSEAFAEIARQQNEQPQKRASTDEIALQRQIEQLTCQLRELKSKLQKAEQQSTPQSAGEQDDADLRERYEATARELRDLKQANRKLQEQLNSAGSSAVSDGEAMDWEAQKRRLLAQLDAESDDGPPERVDERLRIEEVIHQTDRVIAERDDEIAELRHMLENQSSNIGEVAVGASAIAAMLDSDELIREERENLKQLQTQWREKMRQAELDVSIERANLARERTELEERMRVFQEQRAKLEQELRAGAADPTQKPNKRKWMDRLGIKGDD